MVSLEDVKQSSSAKEIAVEWEIDGEQKEIPFKLKPMSYGETVLLAKKGDKEGKDRFSLQYDLLERIVRQKTEDGEWKRIGRKELQELPQGFVLKLTEEVNDFLGLGETAENFPRSLGETR